jgi:hypothetical protein
MGLALRHCEGRGGVRGSTQGWTYGEGISPAGARWAAVGRLEIKLNRLEPVPVKTSSPLGKNHYEV